MKDWKAPDGMGKRWGRRWIRVVALLAAVAVLGILGTAAIGELLGGKGMNYEMITFEVSDPFSDIRVEDLECGIHVQPAADGACRVICPEKQDGSVYHSVEVRGDVLRVQRHDERKWYQFINISFEAPVIEVYLPEEAYGRLELHSSSGSIRVDEGFTFESADLESTSGSVRMESDVRAELRTKSTSGSVRLENISPEMLTAESTSGSVTLANVSAKALTAESTSGRVELAHVRSGEIAAKSTSGRIALIDVVAQGSLSAQSVSGGVSLEGCDGASIRLKSTSGSVKGTLLSGKTFITDSGSGGVHVPQSTSGGACEISTTSGSIRIEIEE